MVTRDPDTRFITHMAIEIPQQKDPMSFAPEVNHFGLHHSVNTIIPLSVHSVVRVLAAKVHATDGRLRMGPGQTGPLVTRLESYGRLEGLWVGAWGEASRDLHSLVKVMAESRVAAHSRARGLAGEEGELGCVTGQIRRVFVRSQALCLVARLGLVRGGQQTGELLPDGRRLGGRGWQM